MSQQLPQVQIDSILLKGGLDQITPTLSLANGAAREAINFECSVTGGYSRIAGYERFDGHPSPADSSLVLDHNIVVSAYTSVPVVGDTLTASGGATGVIAYMSGTTIALTKATGTLTAGQTVSVGGAPVGVLTRVDTPLSSTREAAIVRNAVADIYRADIHAVPGSGPIRGVVEFNDIVYAFRNNAGATACDIYKSSLAGWVQVPLYLSVPFVYGTPGGTPDIPPNDNNGMVQGGVYGPIKRIVKTSGGWAAHTAAGQLIIKIPAGGSYTPGPATIAHAGGGAWTVTLAEAPAQLVLLPGGIFEFAQANFAGQAATMRIYGCDGANKAFEFDGDTLVPLTTGAATDKPSHCVYHKGYLIVAQESSIMWCAPGLPYDWTALSGAGEIATGDTVTGIISMPGDANSISLGIFNRSNTHILYQRALYGGGFSNWELVSYNTGVGAVPFSAQNMAQTFVLDDRGVNSIQTTLQYGNFTQATLTNQIQPFINERNNKLAYTTLCRRKSQYRLFFTDGSGLYITVVNGKPMGCMPVHFPDTVTCAYEGKKSTGEDIIYFGSGNGMVYQMEKGTSFDGADIEFFLQLNFSTAKSPLTLKRYRSASIELSAEKSSAVQFQFSSILGYGTAEYEQPGIDTYSTYSGKVRWDSYKWDDFFWDSAGVGPVRCELDGTAENIALFMSGSSDNIAPFTINSILMRYTPRRMLR